MANLRSLTVSTEAVVPAPGASGDAARLLDVSNAAGLVTVPATTGSSGAAGQRAVDANFQYLCSGTNVWVRTPVAKTWLAATLPAAKSVFLTVGAAGGGWSEAVVAPGTNTLLAFDGSGNPVALPQATFAAAATTLAGYGITDGQPLSAALTTYAGIAPSANVQSFLAGANFAALRTTLGLAIGTDVQAFDATLGTLAGKTISGTGNIVLKSYADAITAASLQVANNLSDVASPTTARASLGLVIGTNVQAFSANLASYATVAPAANVLTFLGAADFTAMQTTMGVLPGTNVQAFNANLTTYAGIAPSSDVQAILAGASVAAVRTTRGLVIGTNVQAFSANLTSYAGVAPSANVLTLLGSSDFAAMRTALSLVVGTNVQAFSSTLATYAGLAPSSNVQTLLGAADYAALRTQLGLVIGTNVQAFSATLATYAGLAPSADVQSLLGAANVAAFTTTLGLVIGTNVQAYAAELGKVGIQGTDIASASSINLGAATGDFARITGTTAITGLGTAAAGIERTVVFAAALTLTYNAGSLILPGAANIVTAANDTAIFRSLGSGSWTCILYSRANGTTVSTALQAANNLADVANAATALTNLNGQTRSANLTSFATVAPSPNVLSFLGAADYASMLAALGVELSKYAVVGASIASSTTTSIGAATGDYVNVTGTTTITSLGTAAAGVVRTVVFGGVLTLTYNAGALILPTGANITTAAGDAAVFRSLGAGNWICVSYLPAVGYQPINANLTSYAGVAPAANTLTFLGAANYAAMRTQLGLVIGTNVQAFSSNLSTYAGIAPAANVQTLLGAVDYAAMRTQLGLVIGTNVQAFSSTLSTYAGIAPAANVQSLLGAANYAAMRTQLGLVIGTDVQAYRLELTKLGIKGTDIPITTTGVTIDLGAADGEVVNIVSNNNVNSVSSFGTAAAGTRRIVISGDPTYGFHIIYNATSMQLPTNSGFSFESMYLPSGDMAEFVSLGSGNWKCTNWQRNLTAAPSADQSTTTINVFFQNFGGGSYFQINGGETGATIFENGTVAFISDGGGFLAGGVIAWDGTGNLSVNCLTQNPGTTTVVVGSGAGTGGSASIVRGNGGSYQLSVTTGALGGVTSATLATVTYPAAFVNNTNPIMTPANAAAAALSGTTQVFCTGDGTTATFTTGSVALPGATTLIWNVFSNPDS